MTRKRVILSTFSVHFGISGTRLIFPPGLMRGMYQECRKMPKTAFGGFYHFPQNISSDGCVADQKQPTHPHQQGVTRREGISGKKGAKGAFRRLCQAPKTSHRMGASQTTQRPPLAAYAPSPVSHTRREGLTALWYDK